MGNCSRKPTPSGPTPPGPPAKPQDYIKLTLSETPNPQSPNPQNPDLTSTRSDANQLKAFPKNIMRFQKYTFLTFWPKFLYFWFSKFTNMYFLIMTGLHMWPKISPYSSAAGVFPLLFITGVGALREAIEDFGRFKSDRQANQSICLTVRSGLLAKTYWRDLVCGDLVLLKKDEVIPADILLLSSSNGDGTAFMQTSNLDGEKNLKPRYSVHETFASIGIKKTKNLRKPSDPADKEKDESQGFEIDMSMAFNAYIDKPSISLYHFEGCMKFINPDSQENQNAIPLDVKNFMFKGSRLKNTDWCIGFVLYTGKHTKMQLNSGKGRMKDSKLRKKMDIVIASLFGLQSLLSIVGVFGKSILNSAAGDGDFGAWMAANGMQEDGEWIFTY